jgi:hypothetical protein
MNRRISRSALALVLAAWTACGLAAEAGLEPRRFAIVVGIDQYADPTILKLRCAVKDAGDIAKVLESTGSYASVKLMTGNLAFVDPLFPSRDNVVAQFDRLAGILQPGDQVLFFFSGHGVNDSATGESRLLTIDSKARDLAGTTINLQKDILAKVEGVKDARTLALVDACQKSITNDKGLSVVGVDKVKAAGKAVVITATGPGKASYEDPSGANGLFTAGLVAGLCGKADADRDGQVSLDELERYLPRAVGELAFGANLDQQPVVYDPAPGGIPISVGRLGRVPTPAAPAAVPASAQAPAAAVAAPPMRWGVIKNAGKVTNAKGTILDGKIYFVGGFSSETGKNVFSSEIRAYDLGLGLYSSVQSLGYEAWGASVLPLDGKLYYSGGIRGLSLKNEFEVYDPKSKAIAALPNLPSVRIGHATVAIGGKIYFIGGVVGGLSKGPSAEVISYDIAKKTWGKAASMLQKRVGAAAIAYEGKIYAFGGFETNTKCIDTIEVYDPVSDKWTKSSAVLPVALKDMGIAVRGGLIYLVGGDTDTLAKKEPSTRIFAFEPFTDSLITMRDSLPVSLRSWIGCSEYRGKLYISGGQLGNGLVKINPDIFVFDPEVK